MNYRGKIRSPFIPSQVPPRPIQGDLGELVKLITNLQTYKSQLDTLVQTVQEKSSQLDDLLSKKTQLVDNAILRATKLQKGEKGDPGTVNYKKVVDDVYASFEGYLDRAIIEKSVTEARVRAIIEETAITKENKEAIIDEIISRLPDAPIKGVDYFDGKDAVIDHDAIIQAIRTLPDGKKLKVKDIEGLEQTIKAFSNQLGRGYLHGGGVPSLSAGSNITLTPKSDGGFTISSSGGGLTRVTITGTIDDSNVTFTSASEPDILVINGIWYESTGGAITWSYLAGTITLSVPVGTGGTIWGYEN